MGDEAAVCEVVRKAIRRVGTSDLIDDTIRSRVTASEEKPTWENRKFLIRCWYAGAVWKIDVFVVSEHMGVYGACSEVRMSLLATLNNGEVNRGLTVTASNCSPGYVVAFTVHEGFRLERRGVEVLICQMR